VPTAGAIEPTLLTIANQKAKEVQVLRSNLIPACRSCNADKGSESWLVWFQRQEFYNIVAQELIEEWISNKRFIEEELDEPTYYRTEVCSNESTVRSVSYEPPSIGERLPYACLRHVWSRRTECKRHYVQMELCLRLMRINRECQK